MALRLRASGPADGRWSNPKRSILDAGALLHTLNTPDGGPGSHAHPGPVETSLDALQDDRTGTV